MDLSEYIADYIRMLEESGEALPPKEELAKEISQSLYDTPAYGVSATPEEVMYYL